MAPRPESKERMSGERLKRVEEEKEEAEEPEVEPETKQVVVFIGPGESEVKEELRGDGSCFLDCYRSTKGLCGLPESLRGSVRRRIEDKETAAVVIESSWRGREDSVEIGTVVEVIEQAEQKGKDYFWIHRESGASWQTPRVLEVLERSRVSTCGGRLLGVRDPKRQGAKYRVVTNAEWFNAEVVRPLKRGHGTMNETPWSRWLRGVMRNEGGGESKRPEAGNPKPFATGKQRGPPLGAQWGDPARW